ncbi:MAG: serine O-acetyltransferase [Burkholderiaceae bacterium]|nr:serine O-acetyltransferase [Burkholderiaceae bacterium]
MMREKNLAATLAGPANGANAQPRAGRLARLREDVTCVFGRDPAARSLLELLTVYPGVHALLAHRLAHALWRRRLRYPARVVSFLARMWTQIDIHPGARIGRRFFIDHGCGVVIGETAEIGDDVTMYHGVTLGGTTWNPGKRHPSLADGVVVGAGATILGPVTVGARARVAANSVVIGDVPAGATVVGIPGRVVQPKDRRKRNPPGQQNHLPDPVGKALGCLHDRIAELEQRLARMASQSHATPDTCRTCDSDDCIETAFDDTFKAHGGMK